MSPTTRSRTRRTLCSQRLHALQDTSRPPPSLRPPPRLFSPSNSDRHRLPPLEGAGLSHKLTSPTAAAVAGATMATTKRSATISSRVAATAEARSLALWQRQANAWAEQVMDLAERTQRLELDLAMQRGGLRCQGGGGRCKRAMSLLLPAQAPPLLLILRYISP